MIAFGIRKNELKIFLEQSLSINEKELFLNLNELKGLTFSTVVRRLIEKNYPESTIKYILHRLKRFNLIEFGDKNCKGKPLEFTNLGKKFFEILGGELKNVKERSD